MEKKTLKPDTTSTKFPRSTNQNQCLGPCYPAKTKIMHPITLQFVEDEADPFCAVRPWRDKLGVFRITDKCFKASLPAKTKEYEEIQLNFIMPTLEFDNVQFLKMYYDIHSMEHAVLWYSEHPTVPYQTIKRIMNLALKAFGLELEDKEIDDSVIDFFSYAIKNFWMSYFYRKLSPYMELQDDGKIRTYSQPREKQGVDTDSPYEKDKKISFLLSFFDKETISELLKQYIRDNKSKWNDVSSHMSNLRKFLMEYLEKKFK